MSEDAGGAKFRDVALAVEAAVEAGRASFPLSVAYLEQYFPWGAGTVAAKDGARVLWKYSRNPLAHNLGLDEESAPEIQIRKNRVGPRRILALEDSEKLPAWAKPPLRPIGSHYVLDVCGLYWGTHRMLHAVLADDAHRLGAQRSPPLAMRGLLALRRA